MRLVVPLCAVACALATASAAQPAGVVPMGADAACLLAMAALSNSANPSDQAYGQVGTVYFMGRIAARDPGFDFARLRSMAAGLDARAAQADLQKSCSPMFQKSMQQLADALAGQALPSPHY